MHESVVVMLVMQLVVEIQSDRFVGLNQGKRGSTDFRINSPFACSMAHAAPTQPAEPTNMQLEESAVHSAAVDPAGVAAAAAALTDLSDQSSSATAGQLQR